MAATLKQKKMGRPNHVILRVALLPPHHLTVVEEIFLLKTKLEVGNVVHFYPGPQGHLKRFLNEREVWIYNETLNKPGVGQGDEVVGILKARKVR